jgi:hypothetical protein
MGLAGAFGDQVYVCKACGHSTGLYSPNCPSCLGKTLQRVEKVQHPGPSKSNTEAPRYEEATQSGRFPIELLAIVLGLAVVGFFVYQNMAKKPEPAPVQVSQPAPKAEPRPRPVARKPVRHAAPVSAARPSRPSAASVAAAHRAPMKIFSSSDDE